MSYAIRALVTNIGKQAFQDALANGYSLQVTHFVVGEAGHDPTSPIMALKPDLAINPTPDATGHRIPVDATIAPLSVGTPEVDPTFVTLWPCVLEKGVATGIISSVYLLAKFTTVGHPSYDLLFPYAYANMPLRVKSDNARESFMVGIQY